MRKILFLDFDGVMVTTSYCTLLSEDGKKWTDRFGSVFDPVCIENLKFVIDETDAAIVVTSTWKMELGGNGIRAMWEERHLPGEVIGVTPDTDILCRGNEIEAWLADCQEEYHYAIIDDAPFIGFFTESQQEHLFKVDENVGIDMETARNIGSTGFSMS